MAITRHNPEVREEPIGALKQHPRNIRQGDIGAISESIKANGWYGTLIAQRSSGYVLVGNHRLVAARSLGMKKVPVTWLDVDDDQALRIMLADNRTNDLATNDEYALMELLRELADATGDLAGTGFDADDLDQLLADFAEPDAPEGFQEFDEDLPTEHTCPKCGYTWSGGA